MVSRKGLAMFTGIIRCMAEVVRLVPKGRGARLVIKVAGGFEEGVRLGESLSINGACLTVVEGDGERLEMDVSPETLERTTLCRLRPGDKVNLERALRFGEPLDGHLVLGHVDGRARLLEVRREGEFFTFRFSITQGLERYVARKGSIALDGISLTIKDVGEGYFSVAVIPYTYENTNLKYKKIGDEGNLEVDIIARYLERLNSFSDRGLTRELLVRHGFL